MPGVSGSVCGRGEHAACQREEMVKTRQVVLPSTEGEEEDKEGAKAVVCFKYDTVRKNVKNGYSAMDKKNDSTQGVHKFQLNSMTQFQVSTPLRGRDVTGTVGCAMWISRKWWKKCSSLN